MARLFIFLPIGIVAVSTASIFIKLCDAPAIVIAAYRMVFASLLLLPFAGYRRVWSGWERKDLGWLILSGTFLGAHFASWIASLKFTSVASSVVLVSTHPIFVGIGSWIMLREPLGVRLIAGIAFTVFGSALISFGDMSFSREAFIGDGLALIGAVAASGYFMVGRKMRKGQDLLSYIFPVYSTAGLVLIVLASLFQVPFFGYSSSTYLLFFLLALIPQLIGHTTFNWALKYLPASMVAITVLGEPIGSAVLAYLILGEGLTPWKIAGGISIFVGILVVLWKRTMNSA
jgi:drug/metabolite transporter (DMT)-like permease